MPQSLAQILVHFVFSTKNRERFITDAFRDDLHAYIRRHSAAASVTLLASGSVEDHIHLLVASSTHGIASGSH